MRNEEDNQIIDKLYSAEDAQKVAQDLASFQASLDQLPQVSPSEGVVCNIKANLTRELARSRRRRLFYARATKVAAVILLAIGVVFWSYNNETEKPGEVAAVGIASSSIWSEDVGDGDIEAALAVLEDEVYIPASTEEQSFYGNELYEIENEVKTFSAVLWKG